MVRPLPDISIIIPVLNEACRINETLACLPPPLPGTELEVIVVDGDRSGSTIEAISRGGIIKIVSPQGRGRQLNVGAAEAAGRILVFLHADTRLPEDAFPSIKRALAGPGTSAGAFGLKIDSKKPVFRIIEKAAFLRTRITRIPYGDQAIFIKASFFKKMGGFSEIPIMEDVDLMRRIRRAGGFVRILPSAAVTSPRRWEKEGIVSCTLRNRIISILFLAGVPPERLARLYRDHSDP